MVYDTARRGERVSVKTPNLMQSSTVMAAGTMVSRVLGFVRVIALNAAIGATTDAANAFAVANVVPNVLYLLVAGGVLNAILVPQIVRATKEDDGGHEYLDKLITLIMGAILVLTIITTAAAPLVVRIVASSFNNNELLGLTAAFAYFSLPQIFFYGLYTVLGQVLNAKNSFGPYMWAPVIGNLVGIPALIAWIWYYGGENLSGNAVRHTIETWTPDMVITLAGGATLSIVAQALFLFPFLHKLGYRYTPRFGFRGVGLKSASTVAVWTVAAIVVGQLVYISTTQVGAAASAGEGRGIPGNASYAQSYLLFMLPHSIVAVSVVTALFTRLSHSATEDRLDDVRRDVNLGLRILGVASAIAAAALIVLFHPVGRFMTTNTEDGWAIGVVAAVMALGLLPFSANYMLQRTFYAFEDGASPFWAQMPTQASILLFNLAALWFVPPKYMVLTTAAGMTVGYWLGLATAWWMLRKKIGHLGTRPVVWANLRMAVAAAIASGAGLLVMNFMNFPLTKVFSLITIAVVGSVMLAVYVGALKVLRVREFDQAVRLITSRFSRTKKA